MRSLKSELIRHGFKPTTKRKAKRSPRNKRKPSEKLTRWEIEELMGVNRPKYSRGRGGSYRSR